MLCMLMLFSASEMWATDVTVDVKCEPTGVAKVYAKYETDDDYIENQYSTSILENSGNFNLKYDNLQEGYTFLGWSKGAPSTNASDMVSTDQVATVEVLSSDPTVTYYANFAIGSNFTITKDADAEAHGDIQFNVGEGENVKEDVTSAQEGDLVTVIVTPDEGWVVNEVSGLWYANEAASRSMRRIAASPENLDMLRDIDLQFVSEDPETHAQTYTFEMKRAKAEISVSYRKLLTHADISIGDIADMTYNGSEQKPDVTVKDGDKTLELDKDYTVAYSNNVNVGTATVTITGIDGYTGTVTKTFTVDKATDGVCFAPCVYKKYYGDPNFTILPENKAGGTLKYESSNADVAAIDANTGEVTIKGVGEAVIYAILSETANYIAGSDWYKINVVMAKLTLDEETANGEALDGADGKWYDVTLKRTLKAGMWNTFAVPFAVDAATLTAMGLTAKALTGSSVDGQTLTLHFADATAIEAGKPYLVKVAETVTNPVFGKVQVSKTAVPAVTAAADFVPTLGKTEMKADDAKSVLFLTSGNKLQYPASLPADFKGFRAYFQLKGAAATARSFELDIDGETTAISAVSGSPADNGAVYTLDGRKVTNPAKKGVYIVNGKKVIIK